MPFDPFAQFRMTQHVALITGGAQNIGEAITLTFAGAGAKVMIADLNGEKAEATAEKIVAETGQQVLGMKCDVTNNADITACVAKTVESFGGLSTLVNNVGWGEVNPDPLSCQNTSWPRYQFASGFEGHSAEFAVAQLQSFPWSKPSSALANPPCSPVSPRRLGSDRHDAPADKPSPQRCSPVIERRSPALAGWSCTDVRAQYKNPAAAPPPAVSSAAGSSSPQPASREIWIWELSNAWKLVS